MPQKSATEENLCFISERVRNTSRDTIRSRVCFHLPVTEFENNYYCLLHLPTKDKADDFRKEIVRKMNQQDFAFDWVWFPPLVLQPRIFDGDASFRNAYFSDHSSFQGSIFSASAFFDSAIFNVRSDFSNVNFQGRVSFRSCEFNCNLIYFDRSHFEASEGDIITVQFDDAVFHGALSFRTVRMDSHVNFSGAKLEKKADFDNTEFRRSVNFTETSFIGETSFEGVQFYDTADFKWSTFFHNIYFDRATFSQRANFNSALFTSDSDILFRNTIFKGHVDFSYATFAGFVTFESQGFEQVFSRNHIFSLRYARLEAPEKLTFINVVLSPSWFMGVDSRKITFIGITWRNISGYLPRKDIERELEAWNFLHKLKLFKIACRHLSENAEINNRFEEASKFRSMAFECERLEKNKIFGIKFLHIRDLIGTKVNCPVTSVYFYVEAWLVVKKIIKKLLSLRIDIFHRLYRWTSSYGESWIWAFCVLIIIILIFAFGFLLTDFQICPIGGIVGSGSNSVPCEIRTLSFWEAVRHSLATATFQSVEYRKPVTGWGETLVILEKIFAPVQAALLALAIRRKFMR